MARPRTPDPGRDLLNLLTEQARRQVVSHGVRLETGEVLEVDDPDDGIVVQLDNMTVEAPNCLILDHVVIAPGDRVLVLYQREEFFIIGVLASAEGADAP
jgi:hypothetical protein